MSYELLVTTLASSETHAASTEESGGILQTLGIDWTLLVLQGVAFLLLVWALSRWVYPVFFRIIEERNNKIEESLKAAREASDNAAGAQAAIDKQLATARKEARDIVALAKDEATTLLSQADKKAKQNAEHMVDAARGEIDKELVAAKKALRNETIDLVAQATEKVVGPSIDITADSTLIKNALAKAQE